MGSQIPGFWARDRLFGSYNLRTSQHSSGAEAVLGASTVLGTATHPTGRQNSPRPESRSGDSQRNRTGITALFSARYRSSQDYAPEVGIVSRFPENQLARWHVPWAFLRSIRGLIVAIIPKTRSMCVWPCYQQSMLKLAVCPSLGIYTDHLPRDDFIPDLRRRGSSTRKSAPCFMRRTGRYRVPLGLRRGAKAFKS